MNYLMARHTLSDFDTWKRVFTSHAEAQRKAGLHLVYILRDLADPSIVVALFTVDDLEKAKAFTGAPGVRVAGRVAGVVSVEMSYLTD